LISLKSGGTGIDLTPPETTFHPHDPWWKPGRRGPSHLTAPHRIGQEETSDGIPGSSRGVTIEEEYFWRFTRATRPSSPGVLEAPPPQPKT